MTHFHFLKFRLKQTEPISCQTKANNFYCSEIAAELQKEKTTKKIFNLSSKRCSDNTKMLYYEIFVTVKKE